MSLVLDCSVALAWCFDDEANDATDAVLQRVCAQGAQVPYLWFWEVANVLTMAERRGRLTPAAVLARLKLLSDLPIQADPLGHAQAWAEARVLAQTQALTVYDAAYLELAARTGCDLATRDDALRAAAARIGVRAIP